MNVITNTQVSRNYWWILALRGVIAVLFGVLAIVWPHITLLVLIWLFGVYAIISGVMAVIVALQERKVYSRWWVVLIEGIIGIIAGLAAFIWPGITALVLLYVIAVWAIVIGVIEIVEAFSAGLPTAMEWTLALAGILSILLGLLLAILPGLGLLSLVRLIGIYAIIYGIVLIIRAFQFRTPATGSTVG